MIIEKQNGNKKRPDVVAMALKKRHIHLLEKLGRGKTLTPGEIKELRKFEGKQSPPGVVETQEAVAKVFHVSTRTVQYWIRDGMPKTPKGLYAITEIQAWRAAKKKARKKEQSEGKEHWEERLKKAQAQKAELALKKAYSEVIDREDVERGRIARIHIVKKPLLALPREIAPILAGLEPRDIEALLRLRINEIIAKFAGQNLKDEKNKDSKGK